MRDAIHFAVLLTSLPALGYGLWLIHPAAMFVGLGSLGIAIVWSARTPKGHDVRRNDHVKDHAGVDA